MRSSTLSAKLSARDIAVFSVWSAMMFLARQGMQGLPNVHPLGLLIAVQALVYGRRALIPLYGYILLEGVFAGFSLWWMPYLYIWLPLWAAFVLLGRVRLSEKLKVPLFMLVCGLHGLSFGLMYAPAQALMFGFSFRMTVAWVIAGLPFDIVHAIANAAMAVLIVPLFYLVKRMENGAYRT